MNCSRVHTQTAGNWTYSHMRDMLASPSFIQTHRLCPSLLQYSALRPPPPLHPPTLSCTSTIASLNPICGEAVLDFAIFWGSPFFGYAPKPGSFAHPTCFKPLFLPPSLVNTRFTGATWNSLTAKSRPAERPQLKWHASSAWRLHWKMTCFYCLRMNTYANSFL